MSAFSSRSESRRGCERRTLCARLAFVYEEGLMGDEEIREEVELAPGDIDVPEEIEERLREQGADDEDEELEG